MVSKKRERAVQVLATGRLKSVARLLLLPAIDAPLLLGVVGEGTMPALTLVGSLTS